MSNARSLDLKQLLPTYVDMWRYCLVLEKAAGHSRTETIIRFIKSAENDLATKSPSPVHLPATLLKSMAEELAFLAIIESGEHDGGDIKLFLQGKPIVAKARKSYRLNTRHKRLAFIAMCAGAVFILAGIFQVDDDCFFQNAFLERCSGELFLSPALGCVLFISGLLCSFLYDSVTAKVIAWVKG